MTRTGRRAFLRQVAVGGGLVLAGCTASSPNGGSASPDGRAPATGDGGANAGGSGSVGAVTGDTERAEPQSTTTSDAVAAWRTTTLTDVDSGESFTVDSFAGQPVLLESFAVWCPVCTTQQKHIRSFRERRTDVVPISLNTDPNENAERVRNHKDKHGFDWRYAVAPPAMTESLIDAFGVIVTNAPAAPVVRICPDGTADLVAGGGAKGPDQLAAAFDEC